MKLTIIGATGMVGSAVTDEALARGHHVTAVSRRPAAPRPHQTSVAADAGDEEAIGPLLSGADVAVVAVRPARDQQLDLAATTTRLLDAAAAAGTRLLVVGGAGPLRSPAAPERLLVDDPHFVPPEWRALARASTAQLRACKAHPGRDWTYLSPPAILQPGERTGRYRRGTDTALVGADGLSRISVEDLAVAVVDEIEGRTSRGHVTIGY